MLTREKFGCANYLGNELSQATRIPVNRNILRSHSLQILSGVQRQQHSLFSQASWGRLEMKAKRNKVHGSSTLIASFQPLLSKAISLEIFQSLRSLLADSSQVSLGLPLPLFTLSTHSRTHYAPAPQEASVGHVQTISIDVG